MNSTRERESWQSSGFRVWIQHVTQAAHSLARVRHKISTAKGGPVFCLVTSAIQTCFVSTHQVQAKVRPMAFIHHEVIAVRPSIWPSMGGGRRGVRYYRVPRREQSVLDNAAMFIDKWTPSCPTSRKGRQTYVDGAGEGGEGRLFCACVRACVALLDRTRIVQQRHRIAREVIGWDGIKPGHILTTDFGIALEDSQKGNGTTGVACMASTNLVRSESQVTSP